MRTIRLNLKAKWYEMIERGIKKEEYREMKPYWTKRLKVDGVFKHYDAVVFVYGYTKRTMTFAVKDITFGYGKPEWGGVNDMTYIIELGDRIS